MDMTLQDDDLAFYSAPSPMTDVRSHAGTIAFLPRRPSELAALVNEWILHPFRAAAQGIALTTAQQDQLHLRPVHAMLDSLTASRPLSASTRLPGERLAGICRHHAVLLTTLLRAKQIPARARAGFADYLRPGRMEDHWICEYFDGIRWRRADAMYATPGHKAANLDFDPLDVPDRHFISSAQAWQLWRDGERAAEEFGLGPTRGAWAIANSLIRDAASLAKVEMLAWDAWGEMFHPDEAVLGSRHHLLDKAAALTSDTTNLAPLRHFYACSPGLQVPSMVLNTMNNRNESVVLY